MEVDSRWHLLRKLVQPGYLPRINNVICLEAHLEDMGSPRVKFFQWVADLDRHWTADRLARQHLPHHSRCLFCDQAPETMRHLMLECPVTRQAWHETLAWLQMTVAPPDNEDTLTDWWRQAKGNTPKSLHKALASTTLLIPWMAWKHRNDCL
jgi:hypothetical protein